MKYPLLVTLVVSTLIPVVCLAAQDAPPPAATPAATANDPFVRLNAVFTRIVDKSKSGPVTADDIAPELKEMDEIIASTKGMQGDQYSTLYLMRARVYVELLEDYPTGLAMLKQVKADFPKAYAAGQVGKITSSIEEKMANDSTLYIGKVFPPFSEKDLNGKPISTAKMKGKIVLVSFWASWSGQCVSDLTSQEALYQKYHDKGFEIIGISVDEERNDLKAMLAKKSPPWPQYCDGRGWKGRLVHQYGVTAVPFSCLLDGEGKIIGKNLRGPALEQKLAKLFGQ
ncbi:MAG TPA: TlpA disulfide reductase family protein [Candidatus Didemnitutus sp.]|nr:TlpA disulfide reductase family protein [Candidatus Didemnitutus sp.]